MIKWAMNISKEIVWNHIYYIYYSVYHISDTQYATYRAKIHSSIQRSKRTTEKAKKNMKTSRIKECYETMITIKKWKYMFQPKTPSVVCFATTSFLSIVCDRKNSTRHVPNINHFICNFICYIQLFLCFSYSHFHSSRSPFFVSVVQFLFCEWFLLLSRKSKSGALTLQYIWWCFVNISCIFGKIKKQRGTKKKKNEMERG